MINLMNKSDRAFRQGTEVTMLVQNINGLLQDNVACQNTLNGKNPNGSGQTFNSGSDFIRNKNNVPIYRIGNKYGAGGVLQLDAIKIRSFSPANTAEGHAILELNFSKIGESIGPVKYAREVEVFARLTDNSGNGTITYCQALGGGGSSYWRSTNGTDIFYAAGNVGIGTNAPSSTLDIDGQLRLTANTAEPFPCDANHDGIMARTNHYTLCICNSSRGWLNADDGFSGCHWQSFCNKWRLVFTSISGGADDTHYLADVLWNTYRHTHDHVLCTSHD